jgi:hypothetical protein
VAVDATEQPMLQTVPAARRDSISQLPDGPLVEEAKELLKLPSGPERTLKWNQLLAKADYHTLVRMTELPARPQLDEDRKALRNASLQQIGKIGELSNFLTQRAAFDSGGFSLTQAAAWEEWGRSTPTDAIPAWLDRAADLNQPGDWAIKAFAKTLLQADPSAVAAGLEKLDQEGQAYFYLHLGKSLYKTDPVSAKAWWKLIKDPDLQRSLISE